MADSWGLALLRIYEVKRSLLRLASGQCKVRRQVGLQAATGVHSVAELLDGAYQQRIWVVTPNVPLVADVVAEPEDMSWWICWTCSRQTATPSTRPVIGSSV